ncbi:MAG: WD40 repeat domain-containing protein [Bacteroidales bacterium]|nr:WD40 repeat domain-containing protein [Bacteroidales bacterium]
MIIFQGYCYSQKDVHILTELKKHSDEVHSVCFSPDGRSMITGSADKTIIVWDFETLSPVQVLEKHHGPVYALEYTHDGNYFLSGGDNTIKIWDKNGVFIKSLGGHATAVWSIGISRDDQYIVSGSFDNSFRIWDIYQGETIHVFDIDQKSILATAINPVSSFIACGTQDGSIVLFTFDNYEIIHTFSAHGGNVYALDFSADGKLLASAGRDGNIKIWDINQRKIVHLLDKHERSVMDVKFSSDGRYLVSASYDATVRLWDVESGEQIHQFIGHTLPVNAIDISTDNRYILSGSTDKTAIIWELHPKILVDYYFAEEFAKEMEKSGLFEPKKSHESRSEYKEREEKAQAFKNKLYEKFIQRLNNQ